MKDKIAVMLENMLEVHNAEMAWLDKLRKQNPDMPIVTAIVMAADYASMERAESIVHDVGVEVASATVGSYARMEFLFKHKDELGVDWMLSSLCEDWAGSDPDDTDEKFLRLFKQAKKANLGAYIRDIEMLPEQDVFTVYRGQVGEKLGISWSLSQKVAEMFANGASFRCKMNGHVLVAEIRKEDVLAFITSRNEREIICDPKQLIGVHKA